MPTTGPDRSGDGIVFPTAPPFVPPPLTGASKLGGFVPVLRLCSILLLLLAPIPSDGGRVLVKEMAVTTRIVRGKPVDSVHRISHRSVRKLYCYSRGVKEPSMEHLKHLWSRNGTLVETVELPAPGSSFAVSSSRSVSPADVGEWRVDLATPDGRVIRSVSFRMN